MYLNLFTIPIIPIILMIEIEQVNVDNFETKEQVYDATIIKFQNLLFPYYLYILNCVFMSCYFNRYSFMIGLAHLALFVFLNYYDLSLGLMKQRLLLLITLLCLVVTWFFCIRMLRGAFSNMIVEAGNLATAAKLRIW